MVQCPGRLAASLRPYLVADAVGFTGLMIKKKYLELQMSEIKTRKMPKKNLTAGAFLTSEKSIFATIIIVAKVT